MTYGGYSTPREGQLSGPEGWRKARGWDLGTVASLNMGQP